MSSGYSNYCMAKKAPLTDATLELVARRFAVLAEPMRLRLVQALFEGERSVNELVAITGGTQANISRHLQTLAHSGMLSRRKAGLQVFYSVSDPTLIKLCELVCGSIENHAQRQVKAFGR
jgi:DNA-binding transcriptional ArsR family regulator